MKTKLKNHTRWIAALVLTLSLTAANSAFATVTLVTEITSVMSTNGGPVALSLGHPESGQHGCRANMQRILPGPGQKNMVAEALVAASLKKTAVIYFDETNDNCPIEIIDVRF